MIDKVNPLPIPSYSQFACIGAGLSAIALGATLKRWYQLDDIRFFERHADCGGTWHINSYPGCGCDVPSALYSFSFALNPQWTKLMPTANEIKAYLDEVVDQYALREKMTFHTEVLDCIWREDASRWLLTARDINTGAVIHHECQVLFTATGNLVEPRACDIPGSSTFEGSIFHSARWNHDINLEGKKVIVIGNGCTATQIVPAIVDHASSVTQIIRTKHWILPATNFTYPAFMQWVFHFVPLAMRAHRFLIFLLTENDFRLFHNTKAAAALRRTRTKQVEQYMRDTAPEKYHRLLIPDFPVGCKRRIFDAGYLKALHNDKITLTDADIVSIERNCIQTSTGFVPADVIVLATGFQTNAFLHHTTVRGRKGVTLNDHWGRYAGPGAYNCTVVSGFPNLFLLNGPNAATGHTSALMASENSVNFALRVLRPVVLGHAASVDVKQEAQDKYVQRLQEALRRTVFHGGCASWYVNEHGWNSSTYPWSQAHYWYRCLFPVWSDWNIKMVKRPERRKRWLVVMLALVMGVLLALYPLK